MYDSLRGGMPAIAFVPMVQHPSPRPWANVLVRTDGSAGVGERIRHSVARLNPGVVVRVAEIKRQIRELSLAERLMAWLAGAFGALATTLAGIGLYGLVAYLAAARRHEIGIRLSRLHEGSGDRPHDARHGAPGGRRPCGRRAALVLGDAERQRVAVWSCAYDVYVCRGRCAAGCRDRAVRWHSRLARLPSGPGRHAAHGVNRSHAALLDGMI